MTVAARIRDHFHLSEDDLVARKPSDHLSRQAWQEQVEGLVETLRVGTQRPAFGLSEKEITLHYHLSYREFVFLIDRQLGLDP